MQLLVALPVALCVASPAFPARPMSSDDLRRGVGVGDRGVSRGGTLVGYVRTTTDPATLKRNADIWVVPADGSAAPKLLIGGEKSENTPRWAPDGRHIAFISSRDG